MDSLLNKSKQVIDKVVVHDEIQSETDSIVKQWSKLENTMSSRITSVTEVGEKWKNIEDEYRKLDIESSRIKDALTNIDQVIRSKNQLKESLVTLHVSFNCCTFFRLNIFILIFVCIETKRELRHLWG